MAPRLPIYLDHQATTPLDPRVLEAMLPSLREDFGNAASRNHVYGWRAEAAVDDARERLAVALGAADPREIVFTSGATESNNLALKGVARAEAARGGARRHLVSVATEHPAVLDPLRALEREGFEVTLLPVREDGLIEPASLERALREDTLLVSVMAANNEIGVVQPLHEVGALCRERGVLLHSDAAQAVGKLPLRVDDAGIDLLSLSGHKIYGPKGVGALYVRGRRPRIRIEPLFHGGGHERGLRSGTLAVPLVVGMARALDLCLAELESEAARQSDLRDHLWARLRDEVPGAVLNGHPERRLPGNLNVSFEGVDGDRLLLGLKRIAVSSGSACSSATPEPSHVLHALGRPAGLARASLRFGLGRGTTREDVDTAADEVAEVVREQRAGSRPSGLRPGC